MTNESSWLWNFLRTLILDGTLKPLWLPDNFYTSEDVELEPKVQQIDYL